MIFEFQRELASGEWKALGLARSAGDDFDVAAGVRALEGAWRGRLPSGSYRVRSPEGDSRWRYAQALIRAGHPDFPNPADWWEGNRALKIGR